MKKTIFPRNFREAMTYCHPSRRINKVVSDNSSDGELENMVKIYGNFREFENSEEYLILGFSPSSIPLKQRWRNNGLSADFLADYLTTFLPANSDESIERQNEIKGAVSYIANELLENAMKFNDEASKYPISIQLYLHPKYLMFAVTNSVIDKDITPFQTFIQRVTEEDTQDLYIEQLEKNAIDDSGGGSGLGLLTMLNDYDAKLGWKFETVNNDSNVITVTTMVQLDII